MPPPGLTNLPSADATDRSTPDAEVSVSQRLSGNKSWQTRCFER
jgi:hypothetical protein